MEQQHSPEPNITGSFSTLLSCLEGLQAEIDGAVVHELEANPVLQDMLNRLIIADGLPFNDAAKRVALDSGARQEAVTRTRAFANLQYDADLAATGLAFDPEI